MPLNPSNVISIQFNVQALNFRDESGLPTSRLADVRFLRHEMQILTITITITTINQEKKKSWMLSNLFVALHRPHLEEETQS